MSEHVLRAILDHQQQSRQLLGEVVLELRALRELSRDLAVIDTRLSAVERIQVEITEECKGRRNAMEERFDGIQAQFHEGSKDDFNSHQAIHDEIRTEAKRLDARLDVLERRAAELGGRWGVIGSFAMVVLLELMRWALQVLYR